jgi:hypothetical protein
MAVVTVNGHSSDVRPKDVSAFKLIVAHMNTGFTVTKLLSNVQESQSR